VRERISDEMEKRMAGTTPDVGRPRAAPDPLIKGANLKVVHKGANDILTMRESPTGNYRLYKHTLHPTVRMLVLNKDPLFLSISLIDNLSISLIDNPCTPHVVEGHIKQGGTAYPGPQTTGPISIRARR
jgi:hypothetical protein